MSRCIRAGPKITSISFTPMLMSNELSETRLRPLRANDHLRGGTFRRLCLADGTEFTHVRSSSLAVWWESFKEHVPSHVTFHELPRQIARFKIGIMFATARLEVWNAFLWELRESQMFGIRHFADENLIPLDSRISFSSEESEHSWLCFQFSIPSLNGKASSSIVFHF